MSVIVDPSLGADDGCMESWGALADSIALVSSFLLCSRIGTARLLQILALGFFLSLCSRVVGAACFLGLLAAKLGARGTGCSF